MKESREVGIDVNVDNWSKLCLYTIFVSCAGAKRQPFQPFMISSLEKGLAVNACGQKHSSLLVESAKKFCEIGWWRENLQVREKMRKGSKHFPLFNFFQSQSVRRFGQNIGAVTFESMAFWKMTDRGVCRMTFILMTIQTHLLN